MENMPNYIPTRRFSSTMVESNDIMWSSWRKNQKEFGSTSRSPDAIDVDANDFSEAQQWQPLQGPPLLTDDSITHHSEPQARPLISGLDTFHFPLPDPERMERVQSHNPEGAYERASGIRSGVSSFSWWTPPTYWQSVVSDFLSELEKPNSLSITSLPSDPEQQAPLLINDFETRVPLPQMGSEAEAFVGDYVVIVNDYDSSGFPCLVPNTRVPRVNSLPTDGPVFYREAHVGRGSTFSPAFPGILQLMLSRRPSPQTNTSTQSLLIQQALPVNDSAIMTSLQIFAQISLATAANVWAVAGDKSTLSHNAKVLQSSAAASTAVGFLACLSFLGLYGHRSSRFLAKVMLRVGCFASAYGFLALLAMRLPDQLNLWAAGFAFFACFLAAISPAFMK